MPDTAIMPAHEMMPLTDTRDASFAVSEPAPSAGIGMVLGAIWRRKFIFVLMFIAVMAGAIAIIMSLQPSYRSEAMLMVDTRTTHFTDLPAVTDTGAQAGDLNYVRSEQQVLNSDELARRVVKQLHLDQDPEFVPPPSSGGLLNMIYERFGLKEAPKPLTPTERMSAAVGAYEQRLGVFSDGKSFVVLVSFSARDPARAQQILATHLSLYLNDQKQAKQAVIGRAAKWLDGQLAQLSENVHNADQKLQTFRESNHLVHSADGQSITGRQLTVVTGQLAQARADLAAREARVSEVGGAGGRADSTILNSDLLHRLREQEATLSAQVATLAQRYGNNYPPLAEARSGLADTRRRIGAELSRSTGSASSDANISRAAVDRLQAQVDQLELKAAKTDRAEVGAAQIDRNAEADRKLYGDLLARSKQIAIQQEIQEPDARVVSDPSTSSSPAFPRRGLLMAVALALAVVLAGGAAFLADRARGPSQSLADIEALCGLPGLGVVPRMRRQWFRRSASGGEGAPLPPRSIEAAAIQTLGNSIAFQTPGHRPRVIVVTSALPNEGKTTVATLLGRNLVTMGQRVLLIDADLRRRGLTRTLAVRARTGMLGALTQGRTLMESVTTVRGLEFDLLPVETFPADPHRMLHQAAMQELLREARSLYDVIIIDTPPLAAVDDALAVVGGADATVLVVRWGRTPHAAIRGAVRRLHLAGGRVAGCVLNDMRAGKSQTAAGLEAYRPLAGAYFSGRA